VTTSAPTLLVVDDNAPFREVLARAFRRRGYEVHEAGDATRAIAFASERATAGAGLDFAVVDLRLPDRSGLDVVGDLHRQLPETRIVVLTGFASIATAVQAVKRGAVQYLPKPATPAEIENAFTAPDTLEAAAIRPDPTSVARLEWEHIQTVLAQHEGNVSATARALRMHRRTLQRKLAKHPVAE
jgi:two-component system response regulator RegA